MFEHMVRTRDTLKNPTLLFQAAFDVAAVRKHGPSPGRLVLGRLSPLTRRQSWLANDQNLSTSSEMKIIISDQLLKVAVRRTIWREGVPSSAQI
jgi:hypothetical protein